MEEVTVFLLLVILIVQFTTRSSYNQKLEDLQSKILELQRLVKQNLNRPAQTESPKPYPSTAEAKPEAGARVPRVSPQEDKKPEAPKPAEPPSPIIIEEQKQVITDSLSGIRKPVKTRDMPPPIYRQPEPKPSFFERNPDIEKFIGENLINKIGIAILVLAIGFFVKYAIDNNWIGPVGRVGIGVLCGGILIGIAHRMRNSYQAFSSVLVGGGLAVLYFTITLAYHEFHLFNQTTSFIILIVITCFAVALSLLYNRQELAVIALLGGLSSPFMVSGDHANYHALFIYLIILNTGLLVIAYNRSWRILNATAFGLTVLVCLAVLFNLPDTANATGFLYTTILYLLFFAINVANNIKENKTFLATDFSILLVNTALYFASGLYLLTCMHLDDMRGLFSAALALINLILSYILFKNKKADTNIIYLLIGITLTFISLTAPIQLHGNNITLFWAAETVLIYWLYLKSGIQLMKLTSLVIWLAMLISLWLDLVSVYTDSTAVLTIMANRGFITTVVAAISSFLLSQLIINDESNEIYGLRVVSNLYSYAAFILLFLSGCFEINHQYLNRYPGTNLNILYLMLYIPAFVCISYAFIKKLGAINWVVGAFTLAAAIVVYLVFIPSFFQLQYSVLMEYKLSDVHFWAHWASFVFVTLLFYQLIILIKNNAPGADFIYWLICVGIVVFLSLEFCLANNQLFYSRGTTLDKMETNYIKVGLPILWGLLSFALMWLGMRNKARTLRIISLTLFTVTLVKLFAFDIQDIPPAGKIAAFFCLGVLLLIISFMYQKVKQIIVEDEKPTLDE